MKEPNFFLDLSVIVGLDADNIDEAEKKMIPIVKRMARVLQDGKVDVLQLSVYSIYEKGLEDGKFRVALADVTTPEGEYTEESDSDE